MHAFTQSRLVGFAPGAVNAKATRVKTKLGSDAKATGKRFLTILMSCLSAWGT